MKILSRVRKNLPYIGIFNFDCSHRQYLRMICRVIVIAELAYATALVSGFIISIGGSFVDLIKAFSLLDMNLYLLAQYAALIRKQNAFSDLFNELEATIQTRKFLPFSLPMFSMCFYEVWSFKLFPGEAITSTLIYKNVNENFEKLSYRMEVFMCVVVGPFFIVPAMIQSYYGYYVLDLGEAAFQLAFPEA